MEQTGDDFPGIKVERAILESWLIDSDAEEARLAAEILFAQAGIDSWVMI